MSIDYSQFAIPKPPPRKREKGRKDRVERQTKSQVRAECWDRDQGCRVAEMMRGDLCDGPMQWCHLEQQRRCFTRGMAPTVRHTTEGSMFMCRRHHQLYDLNQFQIVFQDEDNGANGPIEVQWR